MGAYVSARKATAGAQRRRRAFMSTILFFDDVDGEITAAVREAGRVLRGLGAHVGRMAVPEVAEALGEQRPHKVPA